MIKECIILRDITHLRPSARLTSCTESDHESCKVSKKPQIMTTVQLFLSRTLCGSIPLVTRKQFDFLWMLIWWSTHSGVFFDLNIQFPPNWFDLSERIIREFSVLCVAKTTGPRLLMSHHQCRFPRLTACFELSSIYSTFDLGSEASQFPSFGASLGERRWSMPYLGKCSKCSGHPNWSNLEGRADIIIWVMGEMELDDLLFDSRDYFFRDGRSARCATWRFHSQITLRKSSTLQSQLFI
jgi:hypothetical protein